MKLENCGTLGVAFGPVPSRRLGRSLGINNIPPKVCTYSCVYCQLGRTLDMQINRVPFCQPERVRVDVKRKIERALGEAEGTDYLAFVPDGEPTLDANLGEEIGLLRPLGMKIAVISNSSLIWQADVRDALAKADWVSLKIDATEELVWRKINRPHKSLRHDRILDGMLEFAGNYEGELATETMLVRNLNDGKNQLKALARFVAELGPSTAYLSIATRPPAEDWVQSPSEYTMNRAYQVFRERIDHVECLTGYEGNAFAFTGNAERDLLSITAVHPMRKEAVTEFLTRAGAKWSLVRKLLAEHQLVKLDYEGHAFYVRKLPGR